MHRISRDLDFFFHEPFDTAEIATNLDRLGSFAATTQTTDTLNGIFNSTKVQFLQVRDQQPVGTTSTVAGIRVASLKDLVATKLKAVVDRGELRDYFDIMRLEQNGLPVELGLVLYRKRYLLDSTADVTPIVLALGYFGDVEDDPGLPATRETITGYWERRQPKIVQALRRPGGLVAHPPTGVGLPQPSKSSAEAWVGPYRRADGTPVRGYRRRK